MKRRKMDELFAAMSGSKESKKVKNRFSDHPIKEVEKEIKDNYYKMLCLVVQYEEEISDEQEKYMKELFEGTEAEYDVETCMDMVMEITPEEFQEGLQLIREKGWGANFSMDMLQLVQAGSGDEELKQMVLKLMETLEITQEEKEYVKALCESIQEKSTAKYIEVEEHRPDNIIWERFSFYAQDFIESIKQGLVVDASDELCMIYNFKKEKVSVQLKL